MKNLQLFIFLSTMIPLSIVSAYGQNINLNQIKMSDAWRLPMRDPIGASAGFHPDFAEYKSVVDGLIKQSAFSQYATINEKVGECFLQFCANHHKKIATTVAELNMQFDIAGPFQEHFTALAQLNLNNETCEIPLNLQKIFKKAAQIHIGIVNSLPGERSYEKGWQGFLARMQCAAGNKNYSQYIKEFKEVEELCCVNSHRKMVLETENTKFFLLSTRLFLFCFEKAFNEEAKGFNLNFFLDFLLKTPPVFLITSITKKILWLLNPFA